MSGLTVTAAYGVSGGFTKGLAMLLGGLGLGWLGLLLRRRHLWSDEWAADEQETSDEVIYVYVDDDGVEHEISAEEAEGLEPSTRSSRWRSLTRTTIGTSRRTSCTSSSTRTASSTRSPRTQLADFEIVDDEEEQR
ncbi:hypothetical protein [Aeromicrobium sp. UC242_57]|uniref:hypothetical protein n=1 Tax=Aeromicrobium sp. UC242_57 TaxID=3374624 RepID=UPI0037A715E7